MFSLKQCLLIARYYATLRARRCAAIERAAQHREPVQILFYHRVADEHPNAWTISTKKFAAQIRWLRQRFDIVSLSEAQARIASGSNRWPTACITFDDGYGDNYRSAIPLLINQKIPFTYFVATDHVFNNRPFPHDVAAGRPLPVNTIDQIRKMAAAGVEIGAHTRTHANLGAPLTHEQLTNEIVGSKHDLEEAIGSKVNYFAFPYGLHENMSAAGFRIAVDAGFAGVCSAYGGYNFPGDDAFHLRRIHADPEFIRFANWLTIDPRKLRIHRDFNPGDFRNHTITETQPAPAIGDLLPISA
jgi:peptidoglycan/xylan/chitin deacetylase (PgdA/CDA1 family)